MTNTLVFVDLPSPDPVATHKFYEELFGWEINPRPSGSFHQIVPGEGLHLGIFHEVEQPPCVAPDVQVRAVGIQPRVYILIDNEPNIYLDKAIKLGGTELWREQWWDEFGGWHASFRDPWGNHVVMWENRDARNRRMSVEA